MKQIIKKKKPVTACRLGDNTPTEQRMLATGRILQKEDGSYRLLSLENRTEGQPAEKGGFFKWETVDGVDYPYPIDSEYFLANHLPTDDPAVWMLNPKPVQCWQEGDEPSEGIKTLLASCKLSMHPETPEEYYHLQQEWGSMTAPKDAAVTQYSDTDFALIVKETLERDYLPFEG